MEATGTMIFVIGMINAGIQSVTSCLRSEDFVMDLSRQLKYLLYIYGYEADGDQLTIY